MLSPRNLLFKSRISKRKQTRKPNIIKKKQKFESKNQEAVLAKPPQVWGEDEEPDGVAGEGDDGKFNLKGSALSHSHGVQPLGNLYFSSSSINSRDTGLGNLQALTDELILEVLGLLSGTELGVLSTVSKSFYVFCNHEPLWRNIVLETCKDGFLYKGSWRNTCVSAYRNSFDIVGSGIKVRDFYSDYLFQSWLCANLEMKPEWLERDNIVRKREYLLRSLF
ncbi:UNVERIFIED_CONTAM: F-box protein [Sesamum radiatum]|uniref:F-box protein n=1 Tax=Sesamum radiatum TaxID=300843 RepID=A0AAW2LB00_SESRA